MKYLGSSFSVYPGENKNYRDNYDRIFGKKKDKPEPAFDDKSLPAPRDAQSAPVSSEMTTQFGKIVSFDTSTSYGKAILDDGHYVDFHSTSFQSIPTRFPKLDELVKVTFDSGHLVSVRSAIKKLKKPNEKNQKSKK